MTKMTATATLLSMVADLWCLASLMFNPASTRKSMPARIWRNPMLSTTSSKLMGSFRKNKYLEDDAGDNEGEKDSVELVLCSYLCVQGL